MPMEANKDFYLIAPEDHEVRGQKSLGGAYERKIALMKVLSIAWSLP